jgi:hypothetical protein
MLILDMASGVAMTAREVTIANTRQDTMLQEGVYEINYLFSVLFDLQTSRESIQI